MAGALNIIARDLLGFKNAREVLWQHNSFATSMSNDQDKAGRAPQASHGESVLVGGQRRAEAWRLGEYPGEELEKVQHLRSVPGSAIPAGRALSKGELKSLIDGCTDATPVGIPRCCGDRVGLWRRPSEDRGFWAIPRGYTQRCRGMFDRSC